MSEIVAALALLSADPTTSQACEGMGAIPSVFVADRSTLKVSPGSVSKGGELLSVALKHREVGRLQRTVNAGWIEIPASTLLYRLAFDLSERVAPFFPIPLTFTLGQKTPAETWCGMGAQVYARGVRKPKPLCLVLADAGPALHVAGSPVYNETIHPTPYALSDRGKEVDIRPEPSPSTDVVWRLRSRGVNVRSGEFVASWGLWHKGEELVRHPARVKLDASDVLNVPPLGVTLHLSRAAETARAEVHPC